MLMGFQKITTSKGCDDERLMIDAEEQMHFEADSIIECDNMRLHRTTIKQLTSGTVVRIEFCFFLRFEFSLVGLVEIVSVGPPNNTVYGWYDLLPTLRVKLLNSVKCSGTQCAICKINHIICNIEDRPPDICKFFVDNTKFDGSSISRIRICGPLEALSLI